MGKNQMPAKMRLKANQHARNISKRGMVPSSSGRNTGRTVGPVVLGFFLFVVCGSAVLQVIRIASGMGA